MIKLSSRGTLCSTVGDMIVIPKRKQSTKVPTSCQSAVPETADPHTCIGATTQGYKTASKQRHSQTQTDAVSKSEMDKSTHQRKRSKVRIQSPVYQRTRERSDSVSSHSSIDEQCLLKRHPTDRLLRYRSVTSESQDIGAHGNEPHAQNLHDKIPDFTWSHFQ